jgi:DNA-binding response OmpR family regulator
MDQRVAVVEDEELIRTMLRLNLEREGFQVSCYEDGDNFLSAVDREHFDLILLDIMMPGRAGDEVLREIRARSINSPVLMLTARREVGIKVKTLDTGADDYLPKPFDMAELIARVRALIRRSQGDRSLPSGRRVRVGEFEVDLDSRSAGTNEGPVTLSEREASLVELFHRYRGRTLTRSDILEEVWGMEADPTPRTVDNFIVRLRRLFESNPDQPRHFMTVRAEGYRFDP